MKRMMIFLMIALLAAATAFAGNPDTKRGKRGMRGLDLTEEQRSQIADLKLNLQI